MCFNLNGGFPTGDTNTILSHTVINTMALLLYFLLSFIFMLVIGAASFKLMSDALSDNWAGFVSGLFTTILSFLLLQYLHEHVFPQKELSISRKIIILIPLLLNGLRIIRIAYLQDKTGARQYGKSNIELKANRPLGVGFVVGFLASLFV